MEKGYDAKKWSSEQKHWISIPFSEGSEKYTSAHRGTLYSLHVPLSEWVIPPDSLFKRISKRFSINDISHTLAQLGSPVSHHFGKIRVTNDPYNASYLIHDLFHEPSTPLRMTVEEARTMLLPSAWFRFEELKDEISEIIGGDTVDYQLWRVLFHRLSQDRMLTSKQQVYSCVIFDIPVMNRY